MNLKLLAMFLFVEIIFSLPLAASQPESFVWQGISLLADGEMDGVMLGANGKLQLSPKPKLVSKMLSGPVVSLAMADHQFLYASTSAPAKLWQIDEQGKSKIIFETDKPLFTAIVPMDNGELAVVAAPAGGVYFINPNETGKAVFVPVPEVNLLLGAAALKDSLYLVGGGPTGRLLRLSRGNQRVEILATVEESHLRSVYVDPKSEAVYFGSAAKGAVYRLEKGRLSILYQAVGEVTKILKDKRGRLFASFVAQENSLVSEHAEQANTESVEASTTQPQIVPDVREIKSSQVVRIEKNGEVKKLWQSGRDGVLAMELATNEKHLLLGTGPNGLLLKLRTDGKSFAEVLLRKKNHPEISTIVHGQREKYYFGTSALGEVYEWDESAPSLQGSYLSPIFNMGYVARFGSLLVNGRSQLASFAKIFVRVGNTPVPDQTWSSFVARDEQGNFPELPLGRYNQIKLVLSSGKLGTHSGVDQIRMTYMPLNRSPQLIDLRILPTGNKLVIQKPEADFPRIVTLDQSAFAEEGRATIYAPYLAKAPQAVWSKEPGMRTVYAVAQDEDADALRYQFWLEFQDENAKPMLLKSWSEEPYVTFDSYKLADGRYRVRVLVDDLLTNGPARSRKEERLSDVFEITNTAPVFTKTYAKWTNNMTQVSFEVSAKMPLVLVQCAVDGQTWMPVDPVDGMTDETAEVYRWQIGQKAQFNAVSCRAFDENNNSSRVDVRQSS